MAPEQDGSRRWSARRVLAVAMIVVLVVLSVVVVIEIARDGSKKDTPTDAAPLVGTGVVTVSGLTPRSRPAIAWTGDRLFVFGGTEGQDPGTLAKDGALVDAMTGETFTLPPAPFKAPLLDPSAVRTGDVVLVIGVDCPGFTVEDDSDSPECTPGHGRMAAASYDLARGAWTSISAPPGLEGKGGATAVKPGSTWRVSVAGVAPDGAVVTSITDDAPTTPDFWSFTPSSSSWRHLGSPGLATNGCMVGGAVAVLTGRYEHQGRVLDRDPMLDAVPGQVTYSGANDGWVMPTLRFLDVAHPDVGWKASPTLDNVKYPLPPDISCMGDRVMVAGLKVGGNGGFLVYEATSRTWSTPPAPPAPTPGELVGADLGKRVWTGTQLLFINGSPNFGGARAGQPWAMTPGWSYDPAANRWGTIPSFPTMPLQPLWAAGAVVDYAPPFYGPGTDVPHRDQRPLAVHYAPR